MKLVRSKIIFLMLGLILICSVFTGCSKNAWTANSSDPTSSTKGKNGDVYLNTSNYDLYQMENNKWVKIGNIKGEKGDKGEDGKTPTIEISNDGYWIINSKKTNTRAEGRDGKDGVSPLISISEEGYWVINGIKTAVKAKAQDGSNGKDGQNGTDGKDGKDGKDGTDGKTPTIEFSEDGYWVINGVKTKIKAQGEDGKTPTVEVSEDGYWIVDGTKTTLTISEDGYWVFNGIKTKIRAMYLNTLNGLCTYLDNGVAEKTAGAKYSCEVKPGVNYNFYVLTTPKEGAKTINLIMDQNINSDGTPAGMIGVTQATNALQYNLVAWMSESNYGCGNDGTKCSKNDKGPVTAIQFLNNATKDWINIDNLNLTYDDEGGNFAGFVLNGKARLPYKSEVMSSNNNNGYLYDNLDSEGNAAPYGYWTLSSSAGTSVKAWRVNYLGKVYDYGIYFGVNFGVRPVITLKL